MVDRKKSYNWLVLNFCQKGALDLDDILPKFVVGIWLLIIVVVAFYTYNIEVGAKQASFDTERYVRLRSELAQFKVMAGGVGILSIFVEWLVPLYKALLIMITMLAFGAFVVEGYDDSLTMEFEKESLGTYITVKPWWDEVAVNSKLIFRGGIRKLNERADKRGRLMAFPELVSGGCEISAFMFSSAYAKVAIEVSNNYLRQAEVEFEFTGKKDEKGKFIINGIKTVTIK